MPAGTAAAIAAQKATKLLDRPIIGYKVTRHTKNKTTERSFQVDGWHVIAGGAVVSAFVLAGFFLGKLKWKAHPVNWGDETHLVYLPGANAGSDELIPPVYATSAPGILGGGVAGLMGYKVPTKQDFADALWRAKQEQKKRKEHYEKHKKDVYEKTPPGWRDYLFPRGRP